MDPKTLQLAQQVVRDNPGANRIDLVKAMKATGRIDTKSVTIADVIMAIDFALNTPKAGDLAVGTVVAGVDSAYIKIDDDKWIGTGGSWGHSDERIDSWLAADTVQILRVGAGQ